MSTMQFLTGPASYSSWVGICHPELHPTQPGNRPSGCMGQHSSDGGCALQHKMTHWHCRNPFLFRIEFPVTGSAAPCIMASSPAYMSAVDPGFASLADMVLVVEGKELLVHTQVVAKECRVIQDLCTAETEEQSRPAKQIKLADGSAAARVSFRLEEPFASFCLPEAELLLTIIYDMGSAAQHVGKAAAAKGGWAVLGQAVKLADFLGAHRVLAAVDAGLYDVLPTDPARMPKWEPALRFADAHQAQLPKLYSRALRLAVVALCMVSNAHANPASRLVPGLELLMSSSFQELSSSTWRAITCGLFCGVREMHRHPDTPWEEAGFFSALGLQSVPNNASFTWDWMPEHPFNSPQAKNKQSSEIFTLAGCRWKLSAHVTSFNGRDYLRLALSGVADEDDRAVARFVQARFTLKGKVDYSLEFPKEFPICHTRGYPKFIRVSDLQDESKGYIVNGKVKIELKILSLRILDA